jgi:nucleotide-binding universal stress UspA family protein
MHELDDRTSILVGVDGSATSVRAGWYAVGLARRQHARVTVAYVTPRATPSPWISGGGDLADVEPLLRETHDRATERMCRAVAALSEELGIQIAFIAARGDPFTELCRIAREARADAIVVGKSAHVGHRLAGSVAVRLVKAARWPVTVVP